MDLRKKVTEAAELTDLYASKGLAYYLNSVVIACEPEPKRFGVAAEPWQRDLIIKPKLPAIEWLAGLRPDYQGPVSFLDILPRGHDKSSFEGRIASWLLVYSRRPITGYLVAADKEQADLILQAMKDEAKLNPWLNKKLDFIKNKVTGPGGVLEALPADDAGAYGYRGNLLIFDEFTHWKNDRMWKAVMSGRHKKDSLAIVISNAGVLDTWQDEIRKTVRHRPKWHVFEAPEYQQLASWMTKDRVDDTRAILPPSEARRVLDNVWIDAVEDADYLRRSEVQRCVDQFMTRTKVPDAKYQYVLSWDYGRVNDRSVGVVAHLDEHGTCIVDVMDVFAGSHERPVTIETVEQWLDDQIALFRPTVLVFDPYQMEGTIQKHEKAGRKIVRFTGRAGTANMELAMVLRTRIVNRTLVWAPGTGDLVGGDSLETELAGLRVKRMSYGFRFDHENNKHDDRAVALGMAALYVSEYPARTPTLNVPKIELPVKSHNFYGQR